VTGAACMLALQRYSQRLVGIDKERRVAAMADGSEVPYSALITTLPLDRLLRMLGRSEWADALQYSSSHIIGVGLRGPW
jgi:protoporphyrinogen oxidase